MSYILAILAILALAAVGGLLTKVIPTGTTPGLRYAAATKADFERVARVRGLI